MNDKLLGKYLQFQNTLKGKLERGQNTTEYGIFIAGVVVVVLLVVGIVTGALESLWNKVASLISGG